MPEWRQWQRAFTGSMDEAVATAQWIDDISAREALPADIVYAVQVCAEEILTNVVRHGGRDDPHVTVSLKGLPDRIILVVEDDGRAFDVSAAEPRRVEQALDDLMPGGLGVQLIHTFADALHYTRHEDRNRTEVVFHLTKQDGTSRE